MNCLIAVEANNQVEAIKCDCTYGISEIGSILLEHYNSLEKAKEIVALGNIQKLGTTLAPFPDSISCSSKDYKRLTLADRVKNNINQKIFTRCYSRDMGHEKESFRFSLIDYVRLQRLCDLPFMGYRYVFTDGEWKVINNLSGGIIPLKDYFSYQEKVFKRTV